jgi:3D (Asp-Asp-Asp) domain-containing protein
MEQIKVSFLSILFIFGLSVLGNWFYHQPPNTFEIDKWETMTATVTAYSPRVEETDEDPFISASGHRVFEGMVACPRNIPLYSRVIIFGKEFNCLDRMNSRFSQRFDLFFFSTQEALEFGKKVTEVKYLSYGL